MHPELLDCYLQLCLDPGLPRERGWPLFAEATELVELPPDRWQRIPRLTPAAAQAWQSMQAAAKQDGIVLELISAFRSYRYQAELIARKLDSGLALEAILRASALPGCSEHHTGRAIDLATDDGMPVLEPQFAETPAFTWLQQHAASFGYFLSFPPDNPWGLMYEPWHWCYQPDR
ncbi:M15 family metallopeptidase [Chitinilyticum piscinae]|uniref:D-alanyl-D-alanine carboxypeptidase family protein n=1 Tax=Chitinilyticum piscinae TaxID=2866724 RepID=A0A8J7FKD7_9NEIS|nr:M15 family metallopeptidase [Chitinilyticum piscinae]MBE9609297.1 D-alanyl-D-alanine carboxypeptidase family protein [Chitinilyticum piscinae]